MEIWPEVNYEHLNFVEIEIAAGMFADHESLICVQFDHLWIICHVCFKPFLLHSQLAWGSLDWDWDASFCHFFVGTIGLAKTGCTGAEQAGSGFRMLLHRMLWGRRRVSHCLDLMASSPGFLRHFCGGIFQPCGLIYVVLWKDIGVSNGDTTIRPDVICYSKSTPPSLKLCQNIGTSVSRSRHLG